MAGSTDVTIPETRVLAIASHVVSGHVGNKIAVFVLQSLGCDVAALNTVQFSNHTGYRQWKGSRVSAEEITELYEGLKLSYLDDFDVLLSGYIPGAAAVEAVGRIGKELKTKSQLSPGSFFWVLDPVMGDNGRLYVAPEVVPEYKALLPYADLVLPNQFEAEQLSDVKVTDMASLKQAIQVLHTKYHIPHIIITSVNFESPDHPADHLSVVGSTTTSQGDGRIFKLVFPAFDCYFSGTGDMFSAMMVARMREAVFAVDGLRNKASWVSDDSVDALDLPLARAAEKVLGTMHEILFATSERMKAELAKTDVAALEAEEDGEKKLHVLRSRLAELQLVRHLKSLHSPETEFKATRV